MSSSQGLLAPTPLWDLSLRLARDQATAHKWAWLLGFSLPLSGGLTLSLWTPGYLDQLTAIKLVMLGVFVWLLGRLLRTRGFSTPQASGCFGRGLGAQQAMFDSGQIPLNHPNVVIQLTAELGSVVAVALLTTLAAGRAFVTRAARVIGRKLAMAGGTLAVALLVYGITSSGVVESPDYGAFFALTALLACLPDQPQGSLPPGRVREVPTGASNRGSCA